MPLSDVDLPRTDAPLPRDVALFLREADERIDAFIHDHRDAPIPGFVPSDFTMVYGVLRAVAAAKLAPGNAVCEWGSGFGVVACLGAMLRFHVYGIEIEFDLVEASRKLAADFHLSVEFIHGSFIPPGAEGGADVSDEPAWLAMGQGGGDDAYEELGLDPDDFDAIFAYPWPGEEHIVEGWFERYGAVGALLITYRGVEGVRVQRKTGGRRARS